uniref:BTB domain-containing protein n=1 Tax=Chelonoidis abingdonii TaxID=106734 RepID=A0A8C0HHY8_CHEAB
MDFPQHSKQVLDQLNQQRQLGLLCDCTFVVDGIDFKAHKAVLAACSEYFRISAHSILEVRGTVSSDHGITVFCILFSIPFRKHPIILFAL